MKTPPGHDLSFAFDEKGLKAAVDLLGQFFYRTEDQSFDFSVTLPEDGAGEQETLSRLAPFVIGQAAKLSKENAFAHMDPPTPWITWATALWNASLNQNLLHPATSPAARQSEETVIKWLTPFYGMSGGQIVPGSTLANLTALWAARESRGIKRVVASSQAHISIAKAANLLGLPYTQIGTDASHHIKLDEIGDIQDAALVLTAGTTSAGAIDRLNHGTNAAWVHVDAAWAGPLALSSEYKNKLNGIEHTDSIAISAHKWLFQPKESALVLFKDWQKILPSLSFGGHYLAVPNIGVLGSHGATAVPLLATLMAWGRSGLAQRINICMQNAERLASYIKNDNRFVLFDAPESGVVLWRPAKIDGDDKIPGLMEIFSSTKIDNQRWFRSVAANPNADIEKVFEAISKTL